MSTAAKIALGASATGLASAALALAGAGAGATAAAPTAHAAGAHAAAAPTAHAAPAAAPGARLSTSAPVALRVKLAATAGRPVAARGNGGRDPFFPGYGTDAYDVSRYRLDLRFTPPRRPRRGGRIAATDRIEARARARLVRFGLDLVGLRVTSVRVDGATSRFRRRGHKLIVVPATPIAAGGSFSAVVRYRGHPRKLTDPDGSREGWFGTRDLGAVAVGEPVGTAAWLACNDSLTDKAALEVTVTAPRRTRRGPLVGVANGRLVAVGNSAGSRSWHWVASDQMAPYLATVAIGNFKLARQSVAGIPAWTAIDRAWLRRGSKLGARARRIRRLLPGIVRFERRLYGAYPFDAAGSIVAAVEVGYALETQTRPFYPGPPSRNIIVHETAHQWFGDSVGLRRWRDIWLNEGFATITEWIYRERHGGPSVRSVFDRLRRRPESAGFWRPPPARPGTPKNLFGGSVYVRGAMALEALRIKVGKRTFAAILRGWAAEHRHGTAGTGQFIRFAEQRSGRRLRGLFRRWLFRPGKP